MDKKGDSSEKQILYIFYAFLAIMIFVLLFNLISKVKTDAIYKQQFTGLDLSFVVSAIASSPSNAEITYGFVLPFDIIINKVPCKVFVSSSSEQITGYEKACLTSLLDNDYSITNATFLTIYKNDGSISIISKGNYAGGGGQFGGGGASGSTQ